MKLTLMTYNLHIGVPYGFFFHHYLPSIKELNDLAKVMKEAQADIIGINEVDRYYGKPGRSRSGYLHMAQELGRLLDMNYAYGSTRDDGPWPGPGVPDYVEWGNASNIQYSREIQTGLYGNGQLTRFTIKRVYNFGLPTLEGNEQRCMLMTEQRVGETPVHVYNLHLQDQSPMNNPQDRWYQLNRALEIIETDNVKHKVLMGDFNHDPDRIPKEVPEDSILRIIPQVEKAGFIDSARAIHPEPPKTYQSVDPFQRIDFIFVTPAFKILENHTIFSKASDHRPVITIVEI